MAWTKVKEQGHLAESENSTDKTAKRAFLAFSDTPTTTVAAETASDGTTTIPVKNAEHPDDSTRKVVSIVAKPDPESNRKIFNVEVKYASRQASIIAIPESPLDRDADVEWDFTDAMQTYFIDKSTPDPKTVVTSAGERFQELLERETGSIMAVVTKNIPSNGYSPTTAVNYKDAVNSDNFTLDGASIAAGQCKIKAYTAGRRQVENGVTFRVAKWILHFRKTWDDIVEDRGFHEKDADNVGKLKEIIKGTPPTKTDKPWPLDGAGAKMPNASDAPAKLTFVPYDKLPFSGLNFT